MGMTLSEKTLKEFEKLAVPGFGEWHGSVQNVASIGLDQPAPK